MDEYTAKIHDYLHRLKPGRVITVEHICRAENREKFIEAVARYQHAYPFDGGILFLDETYEKLHRVEIPQAAWDALYNLEKTKNEKD